MRERYPNKRALVRKAGRFAKAPTLEQMGVEIAGLELRRCASCGFDWQPILRDCVCPRCEAPSRPAPGNG